MNNLQKNNNPVFNIKILLHYTKKLMESIQRFT